MLIGIPHCRKVAIQVAGVAFLILSFLAAASTLVWLALLWRQRAMSNFEHSEEEGQQLLPLSTDPTASVTAMQSETLNTLEREHADGDLLASTPKYLNIEQPIILDITQEEDVSVQSSADVYQTLNTEGFDPVFPALQAPGLPEEFPNGASMADYPADVCRVDQEDKRDETS